MVWVDAHRQTEQSVHTGFEVSFKGARARAGIQKGLAFSGREGRNDASKNG